ncbi:hypothetical protein TRIP_C20021 [Candidatus Zixiibacteriota bacterium]|nr:hypothetical protein TRIP_C20021 [candidate division Zixibacteria bacterium]
MLFYLSQNLNLLPIYKHIHNTLFIKMMFTGSGMVCRLRQTAFVHRDDVLYFISS